jgi:hypothetical protein
LLLQAFVVQVTGVGYNDAGEVLHQGRRVSGTDHPSILKVVEVRIVHYFPFVWLAVCQLGCL